jgi:hypothetical protein
VNRTGRQVVTAVAAATTAVATVALLLVFAPGEDDPTVAAAAPRISAGPLGPAESIADAPPASPVASATGVPIDAQVLPPSKPAWLEIPAIGVHTGQIIALGLNHEGTLEVPADAESTGWFTQSPTPGEIGPSVLAAHVDYDRQPGPFQRLHELAPGAEVIVHRGDGTVAVFTLYRVAAYPKSAFPTDAVYGNTAGPELRLITCGGEFNRSTRQYVDNVVAYGSFRRAFRT